MGWSIRVGEMKEGVGLKRNREQMEMKRRIDNEVVMTEEERRAETKDEE
jgi:hypothetical protein